MVKQGEHSGERRKRTKGEGTLRHFQALGGRGERLRRAHRGVMGQDRKIILEVGATRSGSTLVKTGRGEKAGPSPDTSTVDHRENSGVESSKGSRLTTTHKSIIT